MSETWRLFIAVELPQNVVREIAHVQDTMKRELGEQALRWVRPESIHVTLKFLGDTSVTGIDAIKQGLDDAVSAFNPFTLGVKGAGCFPNTKRPRVLWLGITGETQVLNNVFESVEEHITALGFPAENRGFTPHLTIARTHRSASRQEQRELGEFVEQNKAGYLVDWEVDGIWLVRSQLKPSGAVYTQLHKAQIEA